MCYEYLSRRQFMQGLSIGTGALWLATSPLRFAYANTPKNKKLLLVILRGGMDGLAAVVPYGDKFYADARGKLAMPQTGDSLIRLDDMFALNVALTPLANFFHAGEMIILHATATPYRNRSHFDAQDLLENGGSKAHEFSTGWLGRALAETGNTSGKAVSISPAIPLVLRGEAKVTSWAPSILPDVDEDMIGRVQHLYQNDPLLLNALNSATDMKNVSGSMGGGSGPKAFIENMKKAAEFLANPAGPSIGTIDIGGWDTHANQGLVQGRLAQNLKILSEGLVAFKQGMKNGWKETAVLVVTEFGRTVKANGSGGSDHGTGAAAFLIGGNVKGGRMIGDWPGLGRLYEDRDLIPANDLRALMKSVLFNQLGLSDHQLASTVFPRSDNIMAHKGLFLS
jgi:uncharacterized protein (DUF1501 family)